jgi:DNA-binding transcriptional ArsR family regulator
MTNVQISMIGTRSQGARAALKVPPPVDHVVVLHSSAPPSVEAAGEVRATTAMLPGTTCELKEIDPFDPDSILGQIIDVRKVVGSGSNAKVTIVVSDCTNIMAGAAFLGCLLIDAEAVYVREEVRAGEIQQGEERVTRLPIPRIPPEKLSRPLAEVLSSLAGGPDGVIEKAATFVSDRLGLPPQTASYRLQRLATLNLVEYAPKGRNRTASLTGPGRLYAEVLSINRPRAHDSRIVTPDLRHPRPLVPARVPRRPNGGTAVTEHTARRSTGRRRGLL